MRRLPLTRVASVVLLSAFSLAPLVASAQYTGTNGQIFFIYTDQATAETTIAASNPDGTEAHIVLPLSATDEPTNVAVSADGTKLAYVRDGTGAQTIVVANADGSSPVTVATVAANQNFGRLSFSADGSKIIYDLTDYTTKANGGISSVPVTGGSSTQLIADTSTISYSDPVISSTNSKMYIMKNTSSTQEVDSAHLDGTSIATVYTTTFTGTGNAPGSETLLDVSPDGTKLLANVDISTTETDLVSVSSTDGTGSITLATSANTVVSNGYYAPDGTKVVYSEFSSATGGTDGTYTIASSGSGTPALVRKNASAAVWSTKAIATAGTYPTVLDDSVGAPTPGVSGTAPTTPAATLPAAGRAHQDMPLALLVVSLLGIGAIEVGRRRLAKR